MARLEIIRTRYLATAERPVVARPSLKCYAGRVIRFFRNNHRDYRLTSGATSRNYHAGAPYPRAVQAWAGSLYKDADRRE